MNNALMQSYSELPGSDSIQPTGYDVCLVCMPYCDIMLPSLALGLLQASLYAAGIKTKSIYANLLFCEELGLELYRRNQNAGPGLPLAEWAFGSAAFPDYEPDEQAVAKAVHNKLGTALDMSLEECYADLRFVRQRATDFTTHLAKQILALSPRIVGCSSNFAQRVPSLALLGKIHELDPAVITLMGGADCETVMGAATHKYFPWIDYVISGEGEDLIAPLAQNIFTYGRQIPTKELPQGVFAPVHRQIDYPGAQCGNDDNDDSLPRAMATSFAQQKIPLYQDYFDTLSSLTVLGKRIRPSLPVQSSRGCWHGKCKFCGLNPQQTSYRTRPAMAVIAELDELNQRYEIEHFEMCDNILDMSYFTDFVPELIQRGAPYKLFYEIRSSLSKEQLEMLRAAGVIWCQPGVESLHSEALKAMRKGVTAWQNIQTLKWCRQFGIRIAWLILHSFPGDQDIWCDQMTGIIPLLTHLHPPGMPTRIQYHRFSPYFQQSTAYGLNLVASPLYSAVYPVNPDALKDLSYMLEDEFQLGIDSDPNMAVLFDRPGLRSLRKAVYDWRTTATGEKPPMLSMQVGDREINVRDTRPVAVAPSFCLTGLQREIYLSCDGAVKDAEVRRTYLDKGFTMVQIDAAIQTLLVNKLLLHIDNRLLALAVMEPCTDYVPVSESPLGWIRDFL